MVRADRMRKDQQVARRVAFEAEIVPGAVGIEKGHDISPVELDWRRRILLIGRGRHDGLARRWQVIGGTADLLSRVLAVKLGEAWKQTVVVENRAGASGIIGSQYVARQPADGYTLMVVPITHVTNSSLFAKVPFDPIEDFTPISMLASSPLMIVSSNSFPAKKISELVALAKAKPGSLNCGSAGSGTSQHLACELFKSTAKVDIKHVPYKGNAMAMTDVMGGQIELLFDQMATAVPHVKSGRVRALAVTSAKRSPAMPDVPTVSESGIPGFETNAWFGVDRKSVV